MRFGSAIILTVFLSFALRAIAQDETVIYDFDGITGFEPNASLIFDKDGNLYGTAGGGPNGTGTVFELSPDGSGGWTESTIYSFGLFPDGAGPVAPLTFDTAGNLYGTTSGGGGGCGCGTVFMLAPSGKGSWAETVLYSFQSGSDAQYPNSGLIFDKAGKLYGTGYYGGAYGMGAVFVLSPSVSGWTESVALSFKGTPDGASPFGGLEFDKQGNLYGVTGAGGHYGAGTVYELMPSNGSWNESVIHSFGDGNDGALPIGVVTFDTLGRMYGTTYEGGAFGYGTVYQLVHGSVGWKESSHYSFKGGSDGAHPFFGSLIFDKSQRLFGTTSSGGTNGLGTVFVIGKTKKGISERVIHSFTGGSDGDSPVAGVSFDKNGNLFGTTTNGGSACFAPGCGTVFQITP
jgi:uncharacterized repeat protein (TIGR03803 family)